MNRFMRTIRVIPNPWCTLDQVGRPSCVVPFDPEHNPDRGWVGAKLNSTMTRVTSVPPAGENRNPRQVTVFEFSKTPVELPLFNSTGGSLEHYVRAVQDGSLIAADRETAIRCGVPYQDPDRVLEVTRAQSIAKFDREYGEGSWSYLAPQRGYSYSVNSDESGDREPKVQPKPKTK